MAKKSADTISKSGADIYKKMAAKYPSRLQCRRIPLTDKALNDGFGGGYPMAKQVMLYSREGVGKTNVALAICKAYCDAGYAVVYMDFENSLVESLIENFGLTQYEGTLFFLHQDVHTYTDFQNMADAYLDMENLGLIVIDSESDIVPDQVCDGDIQDIQPGLKSRLTSNIQMKYNSQWRSRDIGILWIQQMRAKFNFGFAPPGARTEEAAGAKSLKFALDVQVELRVKKQLSHADTTVYGADISFIFDKNKTAPRKKVESTIIYGHGFDPLASLTAALTEFGYLKQDEKLYELHCLLEDKIIKFKSRTALYKYFNDNMNKILDLLKEKHGVE